MSGSDNINLGRREFLKKAGAAGVALAAPNVFAKTAEAQTPGRQLISPAQFMQRLDRVRNNRDAFYDVQRNYEIGGRGSEIVAPVRINLGTPTERVINVSVNSDDLLRDRASNSPNQIAVRPTTSFFSAMHRALYEANPAAQDSYAPNDRDAGIFEWRSRAQATAAGITVPVTWDWMREHLRTAHGAKDRGPESMFAAFEMAQRHQASLRPNEVHTSLNSREDMMTRFAHHSNGADEPTIQLASFDDYLRLSEPNAQSTRFAAVDGWRPEDSFAG